MTTLGVGIDIGGTKTALAVVSPEGEIIHKVSFSTEASKGFADFLQRLTKGYQDLLGSQGLKSQEVELVGVATPGPLDLGQGLMYDSPNLHWGDLPLVQRIEEALGAKVNLQNDATAAAYAEYLYGAGQGNRCLVYITMSTGIGGGVVYEGSLITGAMGNGAEFGHMPLVIGGQRCGCGRQGCWEAYANGRAIAREATELLGRSVGAREVGAAYHEGQNWAVQVLDKTAAYCGQAVAIIAQNLDPDCFIFGGGVSVGLGQSYINMIAEKAMALSENLRLSKACFKVAGLQSDSALVGAAALSIT